MNKIITVIFALIMNVSVQLSLKKGMMNINIDIISFQKIVEIASSIYVWSATIPQDNITTMNGSL